MKKWFVYNAFNIGVEPLAQSKAQKMALEFLNRHNLQPQNVKITEGWNTKPNPPYRNTGCYAVSVYYLAEEELY